MTVVLTVTGAPGDWAHLVRQTGMFGFLGLEEGVVKELRGG